MSRPLRIDVVGGWYHVTHRGIERKEIWRDDPDRKHFLDLVSALPERYGVELHAWVLMPNHYHLLLRAPQANTSRALQWLNVSYSVWWNRRWARSGPVFQGRFHAVLLEEGWALTVSQYIHLNPLRVQGLGWGKTVQKREQAGVAPAPTPEQIAARREILRAWRWSSYGAYAGYEAGPEWLTQAVLWKQAAHGQPQPARTYRRQMEALVGQGQVPSLREQVTAGLLLGSAVFVRGMQKLLNGNRREQTALRRLEPRPEFGAVVRAVEKAKRESWSSFRDRRGDAGRDLVLWLARGRCGLTLRELGAMAGGMDYLAVSKAVQRLGERLQTDVDLRQTLRRVEGWMSNV